MRLKQKKESINVSSWKCLQGMVSRYNQINWSIIQLLFYILLRAGYEVDKFPILHFYPVRFYGYSFSEEETFLYRKTKAILHESHLRTT